MTKKDLDWKPDTSMASGKGATTQRFQTNDGKEDLTIETTPWGEGELLANDQEVTHIDDLEDKEAGDAFRHLDRIAHEYEDVRDAIDEAEKSDTETKSPKTDK